VEVIEATDLEHAMRQLADRRGRFDTLLLSPGAPSYGQFRDFEERGDKFVALAHEYFGRPAPASETA
jgi:UDP-N-acetylmuramoylalanine--D-glutamate ligase